MEVYLPSPATLTFWVQAQLYSQPKPAYIVTCKETSDMQKAMLEAIGRRENQEDLRYLLVCFLSSVPVVCPLILHRICLLHILMSKHGPARTAGDSLIQTDAFPLSGRKGEQKIPRLDLHPHGTASTLIVFELERDPGLQPEKF